MFASPPEHATKAEALKLLRKFADRSALPLGTLRAQLIPDSSWKRSETALGPTAVQTIARLSHALAFATRTWKNEADAIDWLLGTHSELGGATPFSLLRTESGGRSVEYLMAALEFGFPV
jgi:putative toxin-antitoxin system antitoxin component (TIGR02293 family)